MLQSENGLKEANSNDRSERQKEMTEKLERQRSFSAKAKFDLTAVKKKNIAPWANTRQQEESWTAISRQEPSMYLQLTWGEKKSTEN